MSKSNKFAKFQLSKNWNSIRKYLKHKHKHKRITGHSGREIESSSPDSSGLANSLQYSPPATPLSDLPHELLNFLPDLYPPLLFLIPLKEVLNRDGQSMQVFNTKFLINKRLNQEKLQSSLKLNSY